MNLANEFDLNDYSTVPLNGKCPTETEWSRFCFEKRSYNDVEYGEGQNVGITTGPASNLLVLDVDDPERFEDIRKEKGWDLPNTKTVRTGGGGLHYYFKYPTNGESYANRTFKSYGFDIRGEGGLVVAPGSVHPETGKTYDIENDTSEVSAPQWLLELAKRKNENLSLRNEAIVESIKVDLDSIDLAPYIKSLILGGKAVGQRSEAIMKVLNSLVAIRLSEEQIVGIFENYPIGDKYREKGETRFDWLKPQVEKAREFVKAKPSSKLVQEAFDDSEVGDARIYRKLNRGKFCFDHSIGQWFKWDGSQWKKDSTEEALAVIDNVANVYSDEANRQNWRRFNAARSNDYKEERRSEGNFKNLIARKRKLQKLMRRKNVLILAASGGPESLGISGDEWDKNPWLLGCTNGVVDLKTGEFHSSKYEDYIKTISPTKWTGLDTPSPIFEGFLKEIFQDDTDLIGYIQRLLGYTITGEKSEHVLPILWGQGRNGKGTLLETLKYVLGPLANPIPSETLLSQKYGQSGSSHTADLMILRGKRLVWASETDEGRYFSLAKVKWLVGGDTILARPPHGKNFISFEPSHTLFLLTNSKPHASAEDYAFWKRVHLIPFVLSFVNNPSKPNERQVDTKLPVKLKAEASGILAWLVRGCLAWKEEGGLNPPDIVKQATTEYHEGEDVIGRFTTDCCEFSNDAKVRSSELYNAYRDWCKDNGHKPLSSTKFGKRIGERFEKQRSNGIHYIGIRLSHAADSDLFEF